MNATFIVFISFTALLASAALAENPVTVGYRSQAEPFVYVDEETGDRAGFLYEICEEILETSGLEYEWVEVNAGDRLDALRSEEDSKQSDGMQETVKIDMLCDPLTITLDRAKTVLFSPVVFISGGSYLQVEYITPPTSTVVEAPYGKYAASAAYQKGRKDAESIEILRAFDGTELDRASQGDLRILNAAELDERRQIDVDDCDNLPAGKVGSIRIGVLKNSTSSQVISNALSAETPFLNPNIWETVCYHPVDTHEEGISKLCQGKPVGDGYPITYYFGDRDIISKYLQKYRASSNGAKGDSIANLCEHISLSNRFFSIEPYGLGFSKRLTREEHIKIQQAMLKVFSTSIDSETGTGKTTLPFKLFRKYFPNKRASDDLSAVFKSLIVPSR